MSEGNYAVLPHKFNIGDEVYVATTHRGRTRIACQLCKGAGEVKIEGSDQTVYCPDRGCRSGYRWLDEEVDTYKISGRMTVGQIRLEATAQKRADDYGMFDNVIAPGGSVIVEVKYMCHETGIGSGTVWPEEQSFATYEEAVAYAKSLGAKATNVVTA